ncbi:MAG TPA: phage tail sheath C-terminal domain-containing protein [Candidatus Elarobacter sp.]|jgi:hypothetical protein
MPVAVTYPGVYLEEVSSGVRSITGVATSIAAFVDAFPSGPLNTAVRVSDFGEFERTFGGLSASSEASYGLLQFFLNGGSDAYVVRVTSTSPNKGAVPASIVLNDKTGGAAAMTVTAIDPGQWGNSVQVGVDYDTSDPTTLFNLTVTKRAPVNGVPTVVATESFRNLVNDATKPNDATAVVNDGSQLVRISNAQNGKRPAQTGAASDPITSATNIHTTFNGKNVTAQVSGPALGPTTTGLALPTPATVNDLAAALQSLIRTLLPNATVTVAGNAASAAYLIVNSGGAATDVLTLGGDFEAALGFNANLQAYALGGSTAGSQTAAQTGDDGTWDPSDADGMTGGLMGDENAKTGIFALKDVDLFNILCIPATANLPDDNHATPVMVAATKLCAGRRAMFIPDPPKASAHDSPSGMTGWLATNATLRSRNSALYAPRVVISDPLNKYRSKTVPNSGTLAGVWASTDAARGVWKAPAGTAATLAGVQDLAYKLTDAENGILNPLGINALRSFPVVGRVAWGARTTMGADQLADEYKYIPIRRLALYIEESLFRGTQWVVFEPNDAPLWAQIRLNVGAFMQLLFAQGAFAGTTPQQAYFVQCDDKTNPQASINLGIVNVIVGFAPLKPAEFVVIKIQQIAGTIAS